MIRKFTQVEVRNIWVRLPHFRHSLPCTFTTEVLHSEKHKELLKSNTLPGIFISSVSILKV